MIFLRQVGRSSQLVPGENISGTHRNCKQGAAYLRGGRTELGWRGRSFKQPAERPGVPGRPAGLSSSEAGWLAAVRAGRAAAAGCVELRVDTESIRGSVDLDRRCGLQKALVDQKGVAPEIEHIVGVFLLIQSKSELRSASAGGHIDPDGRNLFLLGEVLVQELLRPVGHSQHRGPPEGGLEAARFLREPPVFRDIRYLAAGKPETDGLLGSTDASGRKMVISMDDGLVK